MEELDLKELASVEEKMPRVEGHVWITVQHKDYIGDSLRPLLDLVQRLGKALEVTACIYLHPECKALYSENPGRWCHRCRGLEYYREAGGD